MKLLTVLLRLTLVLAFLYSFLGNRQVTAESTNNLILQANTGLTVGMKMQTTITAQQLQIGDDLTPPEDLVYNLAQLPSHGQLSLDGQALQEADTFTQADINAGKLVYRNDGAPAADAFGFMFQSPDQPAIERVSVGTGGIQANQGSYRADMDANARYITFSSLASNFGLGDPQNRSQIYVHDRFTNETRLVSINRDGSPAMGYSDNSLANSTVGNYVVYSSDAPNLTSAVRPAHSSGEIYLLDQESGSTEMISFDAGGASYLYGATFPSISADGRYVAFIAYYRGADQASHDAVAFYDRVTKTYGCIPQSVSAQPCLDATLPSLSADGQWIAFITMAAIVAEDQNNKTDVYLFNTQDHSLHLVSKTPEGKAGNDFTLDNVVPAISADGRFVAYTSFAFDLVAGDNNEVPDTFVFDRLTGQNELVSVDDWGEPSHPTSLSVSMEIKTISNDGRFVAFYSTADNLDPWDHNGQQNIFIRDRQAKTTRKLLIPRKPGATTALYHTDVIKISGDGTQLLFPSEADWLVPGDTNGVSDYFVAHLDQTGTFSIQVEPPQRQLPQIETNLGLNVHQFNPTPITPATLRALNSAPSSQSVFTLTALPAYGSLLLNNQPLNVGQTFTQDDIDQSRLSFNARSRGSDQLSLALGNQPLIQRVSLDLQGQPTRASFWYPSISYDGKYVPVTLVENGVTQLYIKDIETGLYERIAPSDYGMISGNGQFVVFWSNVSGLVSGIPAGTLHLYRYDRIGKTFRLIDVDQSGKPSNGVGDCFGVSYDGQKILFVSHSPLLAGAPANGTYVWDESTGQNELVSLAPDKTLLSPNWSAISGDGRFVAFDNYIRDLLTKTTVQTQFKPNNTLPAISYDGRYMVANIGDGVIRDDTNGYDDIAIYDRIQKTYQLVSIADDGSSANGISFLPAISPDGRYIGFSTGATNLGGSGAASTAQLVVRDLQQKSNQVISHSASGQLGNNHSAYVALPVGGGEVIFSSLATNLVPDGSQLPGIYLYDLNIIPIKFQIKIDIPWLLYLPTIMLNEK